MAILLYDNDLNLITTFKGDEIITNKINQELNNLDQMTVEVDLSKDNFELASASNIKGGYLATSFRGRDVIYRIFTSTVNSDENSIEFIANNLGYDDFGGFYKSYTYENKQLSEILTNVLSGTGWSFDISGVKNRTKVSSEKFDNEKLIDIIQTLSKFYKCDFKFEVIISEGTITNKRLVMSTRLGRDDKQNRFVYDIDMTSIEMVEDYKDMISKGIGRGRKLQDVDGNDLGYVNFSDLTFKATADIPLYTNKNQDFLISDVAYKIKKLSNGGHRTKIYDFDTDDPQELLELTIDSMLEDSRPKTTFKMSTAYINVDKLLNVGDTVYIIRNDINLYYTSRIISITYDLLDKYNDVCEVGDVIYKSKAKRIKELEQKTETKPDIGTTITKGRPYPMADDSWFTYTLVDWEQVDENGQNTTIKVAGITGYTQYGIAQITGGAISEWKGFEFPSSVDINGETYDIKVIKSLGGNSAVNSVMASKVIYIPLSIKYIDSLETRRLLLSFENSTIPDESTNDDILRLHDDHFLYSFNNYNVIKCVNFPDHASGYINISQRDFGVTYNPRGMKNGLAMKNSRARGDESNLDDYYYYTTISQEDNTVKLNSLGDLALIDLYKNNYNLVIPATFESTNLSGEKEVYNIKQLGYYSLATINDLKSVDCGAIEYIDSYTCSNLKNLTSFSSDVPIKFIGERAFQECSSLYSFGMKNSYSASDFVMATSIEFRAFKNCTQLNIRPSNYASDDFNVILGNYKNESLGNVLTTLGEASFENVPTQSINNLLKVAYRLTDIGKFAFLGSRDILDLSNCLSYISVKQETFSQRYITTLKLPKLALKKYFLDNGISSIAPVLTIEYLGIYDISGTTYLNLEDVTKINDRGIRATQLSVKPINSTNYPKEFTYNFVSLDGLFKTNKVEIEISKDINISIGNLNNCKVNLTFIAPEDSVVNFSNIIIGSAILQSDIVFVNGLNMRFRSVNSLSVSGPFQDLDFNGFGIQTLGSVGGLNFSHFMFRNAKNITFGAGADLFKGLETIPERIFENTTLAYVDLSQLSDLKLIMYAAFSNCKNLTNANSNLVTPNPITFDNYSFRAIGITAGVQVRAGSEIRNETFLFSKDKVTFV